MWVDLSSINALTEGRGLLVLARTEPYCLSSRPMFAIVQSQVFPIIARARAVRTWENSQARTHAQVGKMLRPTVREHDIL